MRNLSEIERQCIVMLKGSGQTWKYIVDFMKTKYSCQCTKRGMQKILKKAKECGSVADKTRSGRPKKVNKRQKRQIRRILLENRRQTVNQIKAKYNLYYAGNNKVCRETITKILVGMNLRSRSAVKKPLLNIRQRAARMAWAKLLKHWDYRRWSKVCFSDESIFRVMNNSQTVKVRRTSDEKYYPSCLATTVKHGPQVHVWGVIGPYGPGPLKLVSGNLNSQKYQEHIINDIKEVTDAILFPFHNAIFMQDKAPAHWSASTRKYLADANVPLLPWPGNSPDANPIENVWFHIGRQLKDFEITNKKQLFDKVKELWYNMEISYLQKLYQSMPNRLHLIIKNKGGATKY